MMVSAPQRLVLSNFLDILTGKSLDLSRALDLFDIFGHADVMSFVDKEGILSRPTPVPDKIFLLQGEQAATATAAIIPVAAVDTTLNNEGDIGSDVDNIRLIQPPRADGLPPKARVRATWLCVM